jgi:transcriptional regulator with XRE-family HTH domain
MAQKPKAGKRGPKKPPEHVPKGPYPEFGRRLRRLREAAGLTREWLAVFLGTDGGTIWRWEDGRVAEIRPSQERMLAALYGCEHGDISSHEPVEDVVLRLAPKAFWVVRHPGAKPLPTDEQEREAILAVDELNSRVQRTSRRADRPPSRVQ